MATLTANDIPDLIESTENDLGRMKLTDLTSTVQHYRGYNRLWREPQVDVQGGANININILTEQNNTSRFVGMYAVDGDATQVDGLDHGTVPWRFADFYWAWEENEMDINSGAAVIQDYVRVKRLQALLGWATFIDTWWFAEPPSSTNKLTPYNLRYWITKDVTTAGADGVAGSGSHSGAAPSGHSTKGGINPTTYTNWKNYTFKYVDISEDDLIVKWRNMLRRINFEPPMGATYPPQGGAVMNEHLIQEEMLSGLERLAETRNDNLGFDFAATSPTFGRAPLTWCPRLDSDTDDPIYTMDWGVFKTCVLRGKFMRERKAYQAPRQHKVWVRWYDTAMNVAVLGDIRRLGVGSRAAANP